MNKQENQEVVTNINSKRGRTMSNTEVYIVAFIWYAMITALVYLSINYSLSKPAKHKEALKQYQTVQLEGFSFCSIHLRQSSKYYVHLLESIQIQ